MEGILGIRGRKHELSRECTNVTTSRIFRPFRPLPSINYSPERLAVDRFKCRAGYGICIRVPVFPAAYESSARFLGQVESLNGRASTM